MNLCSNEALRVLRGASCVLSFLLILSATACGDDQVVTAVTPRLLVSGPLDFSAVTAGGRSTLPIELKNVGNGTLEVEVVGVTTDTPFTTELRKFLIPPDGVANVAVTFAPIEPRSDPWQAIVDLTSNDPDQPQVEVTVEGLAVVEVLAFDPDPLRIGPLLVGSTWTGTLQITNTTEDDRILAGRVTGSQHGIIHEQGAGRFSLEGPLRAPGSSRPIAAGETVTVDLAYVAPSEPEETTARLDFTYCGGAECIERLSMTAQVTDRPFVCRPGEINFGFLAPNVEQTATSTCTNVVDTPVRVEDVDLILGGTTFVVESERPRDFVEPGESFVVAVRALAPDTLLGRRITADVLVVPGNVQTQPLSPTTLSVVARIGMPQLIVSPTSLQMGPVVVSTTATRDIVIENEGLWPIEITPELAGDGEFAIGGGPQLIGAGEVHRVVVSFTPTSPTSFDASVRLNANGLIPEVVVVLDGEGVASPSCGQIEVPASVDLGLVQLDRQNTIPIRMFNRGTSSCLVGQPYLDPTSATSFEIVGTPASGPLDPGASRGFDIAFLPDSLGEQRGELRFYVSVPGDTRRVVNLIGEGVTDALLVSPSHLDFGAVDSACTVQSPIRIYNTLGAVRRLDRLELLPAGSSFSVTSLPAGSDVFEGAFQSTGVIYRPRSAEQETGMLRIFEQGRTRPYVVGLRGRQATETIEERYQRAVNPKLDVLVVLPTGISSISVTPQYASNLRSLFLGIEDARVDYRVAVLHPQLRWPGGAPCIYALERPTSVLEGQCAYFPEGGLTGTPRRDWRVINANTAPDPLTAFERMLEPQGTSTDAFEAIFRALSPPLSIGWNDGFLRPNAHLAVVLITDLDDQSTGWMARDLDLYLDFLRRTKGHLDNNRISVSAVSRDSGFCAGMVSTPRLIRAANEMTGIIEPACGSGDWGGNIGRAGLSVIGNRARFELGQSPIAASLSVDVDGAAVTDWTYDGATNTVRFGPTSIPTRDQEVVFRYQRTCP